MAATGALPYALVLIISAGLLAGVGGPALLRSLPEPLPPADADDELLGDYLTKISYRSLASARFGVIIGLIAAATTAIAVATRPVAYWQVWLVYGTVVLLLAAIDARTTWLPAPLMRLGWIGIAAAVVAGLIIDEQRGRSAVAIGCSILIAAGGYLVLWLATRGRAFAFGDVRLMLLVGAVAGTMGWSGLYWSLLLGSVIGALVGLSRMMIGRRGPFPYAPALVSGPYAAALLLSLLR